MKFSVVRANKFRPKMGLVFMLEDAETVGLIATKIPACVAGGFGRAGSKVLA